MIGKFPEMVAKAVGGGQDKCTVTVIPVTVIPQARVSPPDFAVAYVKVIGKFPEMVAKAMA